MAGSRFYPVNMWSFVTKVRPFMLEFFVSCRLSLALHFLILYGCLTLITL